MDSKKSLLMNVSKDEMDTIDEILQSRQTGSPVERRTSKLILTSPQYLISVPGKVKAPVNIPIKTIGALYELNTKDWESKHLEETLEIDIEKDNNYKPFHSTSKIFEDLISLEHNYAIKLPYSPKRNNQKDETTAVELAPCNLDSEKEKSAMKVRLGISNVSQPVRRSRRQIEKLEREQEAALNVDDVCNEEPKEKIDKLKKISDENDKKIPKEEIDLNQDYPKFEESNPEINKMHLKVMMEDCRKVKIKQENDPVLHSKFMKDIPCNDLINVKYEEDSEVDNKKLEIVQSFEPQLKSKNFRKTKQKEFNDEELEDQINIHKPLFRKMKKCALKMKDKSLKRSAGIKKKFIKNANKCFLKNVKFDEFKSKQKSTIFGVKRKKHNSLPCEKNANHMENSEFSHASPVKRKKSVSFSENLVSSSEGIVTCKQELLPTDCQDSPPKSIMSPVLPSMTPSPKIHKKKLLRRDNLRLAINKDEPPLFSQPDVLRKISIDDNTFKKDGRDSDSNLLNECEGESKVKTINAPTSKNIEKEKQNLKNKQSVKPTLKLDKKEIAEERRCEKKKDNVNQVEKEKKILKAEQVKKEQKPFKIKHEVKEENGKRSEQENKKNERHEKKVEKEKRKEKLSTSQSKDKSCSIAVKQENDKPRKNLIKTNDSHENRSMYCNIETLFETAKLHLLSDEDKLLNNFNDKDLSIAEVSKRAIVAEEKDGINSALIKIKNDSCSKETVIDAETDKHMLPVMATNNEEKLKPERKSCRIIKRKEFFGDTSDSSDFKKFPGAQNKPNINKKNAKGKKTTIKIKDENDTDPDFREDDDPEKLWCVCRKPHNSRFMIQCDKCKDWFHGSCVGVTKQYGRQLEKEKKEWNCPKCHMSGGTSPQEAEKSLKQISDVKILDKKISKISKKPNVQRDYDNRRKVFFFGTDTVKFSVRGKRKQVPDAKTSQPSSFDKSLNDENSSKKEISKQPVFTIPKVKSEKSTTTGISKQSSFTKPPSTLQQNIHTDSKLTDDHPKNSLSIEQSASVALNANVLCKTPISPKQSLLLTQNPPPPEIKKEATIKVLNQNCEKTSLSPTHLKNNTNIPLKDKDEKKIVVKKTQKCIHCQAEAKVNSCYCSDDCIEKYAIQCIQTLREAREDLKDVEFDSQKLTVFNGLKGDSTITESGPTTGEVVSWLKANPCCMISCSMQNDVSLQKNECDSSTEKKDAAKANVRVNVRKTLKNILMDRCKNADDIEMPEDDIHRIAIKIEEELNSLYKDNNNRYRTKYRSLMFNIKDPRNQGLFRKILKGIIPPGHLVRMSSDEMASMELAKWREQENQHVLDMIKRMQLEQQKSGSGILIKKTHKGEVEIGDDLTSIVEQEIPEVILKDVPDDIVEPEKKEVKDSTHLHRSHLFDLNCKICTGKIVPPPVEDVPKKVRVAHSISVDVSSSNASETPEKVVSKVSKEKLLVSNVGDDSMDQEPTSTVSESPDINVNSAVKEIVSKSQSSVWKGFIFMQDIAKFVTSAYKVSGRTDRLQFDLPDTIQVCGRIIPDQVWDYISKIKQSGNKELVIIRFQAANEEEAVAYDKFYSYLSNRKRYGVVANYSKKIKDFYLLPLAATSPVPVVLVPFDGPGLPSPRPHLLLGVIVRHKFKQNSTSIVSKKSSVSKVETKIIGHTRTPSPEPRSYTPPLPTLSLNPPKEQELEIAHSLIKVDKEVPKSWDGSIKNQTCNILLAKETSTNNISVEKSSIPPSSVVSYSDSPSKEKIEYKPYDLEQETLHKSSGQSKEIYADTVLYDSKENHSPLIGNIEQQYKILKALTQQVEETGREVDAMAMQQLTSQPIDDMVQHSPDTSLDISSVTTGMSSFFTLTKNVCNPFNSVNLKSCETTKEILQNDDVETRIKTLFGKQLNEPISEETRYSNDEMPKGLNATNNSVMGLEEASCPHISTPPLNDEDINRSSAVQTSDPRLKLKTGFPDFTSRETFPESGSVSSVPMSGTTDHVQMHLKSSDQKSERCASIPSEPFCASWNPGEQLLPAGVQPTESLSQESSQIKQHTSLTPMYVTSTVVPDSSQNGNSSFVPQSFSSFQPCLPLGFSVHTPPPNIRHLLPSSVVSTSFSPPSSLPMNIVPPVGSANNVSNQWSASQLPSHSSNVNEWHAGTSHWNETSKFQNNNVKEDSRYYPSDRSKDYHSDHSSKRNIPIRRRCGKLRKFMRGNWVKLFSKGNSFRNQRRGKRDPPSFKRNPRK